MAAENHHLNGCGAKRSRSFSAGLSAAHAGADATAPHAISATKNRDKNDAILSLTMMICDFLLTRLIVQTAGSLRDTFMSKRKGG